MKFIDLDIQQRRIRPQIEAAINRVLDHGQYIQGPEVSELEERLADFVGVRHVIGCSSGTDALLLPLMAYGIGPGDAIFTTPFSFFATSEVIALTGATPVFVDIDPGTFNINPIKLEEAIVNINRRSINNEQPLIPKGIIAVDIFGLPAEYNAISAIANKYGLFVLEDAAQSFGAEYKGRKAPGLGHVGATSFFPAKPLGCYGDGGAVFTDDDDLAGIIRSLVLHGKGADKYDNQRIGLNARLDTIQAAILNEKLKIYPEEIALRQEVAYRYSNGFERVKQGIISPTVPEGSLSVWAQYTVTCNDRDEVQAKLSSAGIPSMIYYVKPLHLLGAMAYLGQQEGNYPVAESVSSRVLSLPMYPYLSESEQNEIIDVLVG